MRLTSPCYWNNNPSHFLPTPLTDSTECTHSAITRDILYLATEETVDLWSCSIKMGISLMAGDVRSSSSWPDVVLDRMLCWISWLTDSYTETRRVLDIKVRICIHLYVDFKFNHLHDMWKYILETKAGFGQANIGEKPKHCAGYVTSMGTWDIAG